MMPSDRENLAELLFSDITDTPDELEKRYPQRDLPQGARVCRMAPSPTGFMHLGNLYGAIADERLAHQGGGVFFLRIEDTDQKRTVEGGVEKILNVFNTYGLRFDEGVLLPDLADKGCYGPYRQRQRTQIYHVCVKYLLRQGMAYPCFLTEKELEEIRRQQAAEKLDFGCYGRFARYRSASVDEVRRLIACGMPYVVRLRSAGSPDGRITVNDAVRGKLEMPENCQDVVLLKADGIPTYHFAHAVDDHFMRTSLVVRGEEWLATLPIHIQLFSVMGWKAPKYLHTASLMKQDGGGKRKLSKRKDPELALDYYSERGYPAASVKEYLLSLLNSNFEDWRTANPGAGIEEFPFSPGKMSVSGALFSVEKLDDVSRGVIARMDAETVRRCLTEWAAIYEPEFARLLRRDERYTVNILSVGRGGKKPRKDLTVWSEAKTYFSFYFDELFCPDYALPNGVSAPAAAEIIEEYRRQYTQIDDSVRWFEKVKELARAFGYADDMRKYKENPAAWPGSVADISAVLRLAVTGRRQSPDLCEVMKVMGAAMVQKRLALMHGAMLRPA